MNGPANTPPPNGRRQELLELLEWHCDRELAPSDWTRLNGLLRDCADLRESYLEYMRLHAVLAWGTAGRGVRLPSLASAAAGALGGTPAAGPVASAVRAVAAHPGAPSRWWRSWLTKIAPGQRYLPASRYGLYSLMTATCATLLLVSMLAVWQIRRPAEGYHPYVAPVIEAAHVATLKGAIDCRWEGASERLPLNTQFGAERLRLVRGVAQLQLGAATMLILEGPAELELISDNRVHLHSGRLVSHVPPVAKGFTVATAPLVVVDLGTEFGVSVDGKNNAEVHVFQGRVEVISQIANEGDDDANERRNPPRELTAGEALRYTGEAREIEALEASANAFVRRLRSTPYGAPEIDEAYVAAVLADAPVAYWRFEKAIDHRFENAVADKYHLQAGQTSPLGGGDENRWLVLPLPDEARLVSTEPIDELTGDEYTIEGWLRPLSRNSGTIWSLTIFQPNREMSYAGALQLIGPPPESRGAEGNELGPLHQAYTDINRWEEQHPNSIRALHRSPASQHANFGDNIYAKKLLPLSEWSHLAVRRKAGELQLFVNGEQVGAAAAEKNLEPGAHLVIGMVPSSQPRSFIGMVDEIAVYGKALGDETLRERYRRGLSRSQRDEEKMDD